MRRLFPTVPPDHPAMSAMVMNLGSTMLGLDNAATPFGIRAMEELDKLNGEKGTATNAMVLFLAINTAGLSLLPTSIIALRAAAGSTDAAGVFVPIWFASGCATVVGILAAFSLSRLPALRASEPPPVAPSSATVKSVIDEDVPPDRPLPRRRIALWAFWVVFAGLLVRHVMLTFAGRPFHEPAREILSYLSIGSHFDPMLEGLVRLEDLVYFGVFIVFFLTLVRAVLESLRWR